MKTPNELRADPRFDHAVGRLVGATEMLTSYLALHGDEKMRGMAERAYTTLAFFLVEADARRGLPPPATEEVTREIPPPRTQAGRT